MGEGMLVRFLQNDLLEQRFVVECMAALHSYVVGVEGLPRE
jgi:hypothetical protein